MVVSVFSIDCECSCVLLTITSSFYYLLCLISLLLRRVAVSAIERERCFGERVRTNSKLVPDSLDSTPHDSTLVLALVPGTRLVSNRCVKTKSVPFLKKQRL